MVDDVIDGVVDDHVTRLTPRKRSLILKLTHVSDVVRW